MTEASRYLMGKGRPCIAVAHWRFLTKSRLDALQAQMVQEFAPQRWVMHPVVVVGDGLHVVDFYLDDKECLEDISASLGWLDRADLGHDFELHYLVDEEEDERVGALLRHTMENGGGMAGLAGTDPRTLGRAYGYYLATIDYPWRALQLGPDPAVTEKVAALPYADQPKLEARTLTPHGHRVFSFFQNMDAWHSYLDVVTPMFNEQSVSAVANKVVDRAHEVSCDALLEPQGEPPEPVPYWEPPGFVSPLRASEQFSNTGH